MGVGAGLYMCDVS